MRELLSSRNASDLRSEIPSVVVNGKFLRFKTAQSLGHRTIVNRMGGEPAHIPQSDLALRLRFTPLRHQRLGDGSAPFAEPCLRTKLTLSPSAQIASG